MTQGLQIEELGLLMLDTSELHSIDGGDTVNTSYHGGDSQLDWSRLQAAYDFANNFLAGFGAAF